jgi:hypothetical protein
MPVVLTPPLALVLAVALALAKAPAIDDPKEVARDFAKRAAVAFNIGHYEEAAGLYEQAYRLVQDPTLLFDIGQAYRLGEQAERALAAYKGFLRTAPAGHPNRANVEVRVAELEKSIETRRQRDAVLAVTPPPAREPGAADSAPPPLVIAAPAPPAPPPPGISAGPVLTTPVSEPLPVTVATAPAPPVRPFVTPLATGPRSPVATMAPPADEVSLPPRPAVDAGDRRSRATLGADLGVAGRSGGSDDDGVLFRGFGRYLDGGQRTWEVGFARRPLYPMNPRYQYSALYGLLALPSGWGFEVGALGGQKEFHAALARSNEFLSWSLGLQNVADDELCNQADGSVLFGGAGARLRVPLSTRVSVAGVASYRGRLARTNCPFPPSLMTLGAGVDVQLGPALWLAAGGGGYGLYDFGPSAPAGWAETATGSAYGHLGARWTMGQVSLLAHFRHLTYGGGTNELTLGVEFRSLPDAP